MSSDAPSAGESAGRGAPGAQPFVRGMSLPVAIVLLATAYLLVGRLGLSLALAPGFASPVAPAAGIALSAVLLLGARVAPGIALGSFALALWAGLGPAALPLPTALGAAAALSLGATLQALVARALVRRFVGEHPALDGPNGVLRFLGVVAPFGSLVAAPIAAAALLRLGVIQPADFVRHCATFWVGDAVGAISIAPVVLVGWAERGSAGRRRRVTVGLSGLGAFVLACCASLFASHLEGAQLRSELEVRSDVVANAVRRRIENALDAAGALGDFCSQAAAVDRGSFDRFAGSRARQHPWVRAFAWAPRVVDADLAAFEQEGRRSGLVGYRVSERDADGDVRSASQRAEHFPVQFVAPSQGNSDALGFDLASSPERFDAIARARETGAVAVTALVRLAQAPGATESGVVVVAPVFAQAPAGVSRGELRGVAIAAVPVGRLVRAALDDTRDSTLAVRLEDLGASGDARLLFDSGRPRARGSSAIAAASLPEGVREHVVGGRRWGILVRPTAAYRPSAGPLPALGVLMGKLGTTVVLVGFLLVLTGHAARVERLVTERTQRLHEANAQLLADVAERARVESELRLSATVFEASADAICVTDVTSCILSVNGAFERITGYSASEVIGKTPRVLKSGRHDKAFYERMWASVAARGEWQGEVWNRRKDGRIYPEWLTVSAVLDEAGCPRNYVGISTDMSERKSAEERIEFLAHHDALTGLPNRVLLRDRFDQAAARAARDGTQIALVFLDLDRFKTINDSLGHPVGDCLLQVVSTRLLGTMRRSDTVSRLGGDEFALILGDAGGAADIERTARKIIASVAEPVDLGAQVLHTGCSLGISLFPHDGVDVDTLLQKADTALYAAKGSGRGVFRFFTPEMNAGALERMELEKQLRLALERSELRLHYQPQVDLNTGRLVGVEALLRWQSPELGLVLPGKLVPVAEQSGLIVPIGDWALREACRQSRAWQDAGLGLVPIAVNISAFQLQREGFVESVGSVLSDCGIAPEGIELELTESMLAHDVDATVERLAALKAIGLQLAIDDFGTGYSSLAYLDRFAVDRIKIDQSFVRVIGSGREDAALVRAIVQMARALDLRTTAEGVETEMQAAFLRAEGCEGGQGYHFGRPVPPAELARLHAAGAWRGAGI